MATDEAIGAYFAEALEDRKEITDQYEVLGDLPQLVGVSTHEEDSIVAKIRQLIQEDGGGTTRIQKLSESHSTEAARLYHEDLIGAVDGTDAVAPVRFVADTIYAVGMVLVTPKTQHQPRAYVTRTKARHKAPTDQRRKTVNEQIQNWGEKLRGAREHERSWINTFREYGEREVALKWLKENTERIVLADGPVLTQNMLTQNKARDLLRELVETQRVIGFIKDLSANPLLAAIGYGLEAGETFVLSEWTNVLSDRFQKGQTHISKWIEKHATRIIRAVYKTRTRAFAVECHATRLPLAFAILEHDNDGSHDHDIPMLVQIADKYVRTRFNGDRARAEVIARFAESSPNRFLQLTNERGLR